MKILFIYNKKAGKKFEPSTVNIISELVPQSFDFSFVDIRDFNSYDISSFDTLTAIGGDGTVNTVAKVATEQNKTLAIIPKGSGDGLARFLGISKNVHAALETVLQGKTIRIDTAEVSDQFFINVAGAGFEAEVAHKFGREGVRGLKGYAKTIINCFDKRKEKNVRLFMDGKESILPFFSLSIANGAQWGNNFEIASNADIQDGYLDVAIMRKPKIHQIPKLIRFLRGKKQYNNSLFSYFKAEKIDINKSGKLWHIDGEPVILKKTKTVTIAPKSLKIIVPK